MNDPIDATMSRGYAEERARLRTVTDRDLLMALRRDEPLAWSEFATRASRILDATARRLHFSDDERAACGDALLARLAAHLSDPTAQVPEHLSAYIAHAAVRCRREFGRNNARSAQRQLRAALADAPADLPDGGHVIASVLSEHTRRASRGVMDTTPPEGTRLVAAIAGQLLHELREIDVQLLTWHAASVPHSTMGAWLDMSAAAVAKRIQRLQRRARARVLQLVALLPAREQDVWRRQWKATPLRQRLWTTPRPTPVTDDAQCTSRDHAETPGHVHRTPKACQAEHHATRVGGPRCALARGHRGAVDGRTEPCRARPALSALVGRACRHGK